MKKQFVDAWSLLRSRYLDRFTALEFSDPVVEKDFNEDYLNKSVGRFRLGAILGCVLYLLFGLLDRQLILEIKHIAWFIRFCIVLPLTIFVLIVSFSQVFRKHLVPLFLFFCYVSVIGINIMVALASSPGNYLYYAGLLLSTSFCLTFMQFPFRQAAVMCWIVFLLYEVTAIWISHFSMPILLNNTFFFVAFNITGMAANYAIEKYRRSDFIKQRTILKQTERLREALLEIEQRRSQAEEISRRDALTNLFNRRHFFSVIEHERNKVKRHGRALAVMLLDVDYFKQINDTFGHAVGDKVLQAVGRQMQGCIRQADVACRYGGDEFAGLFPETDINEVHDIARRLCDNLRQVVVETEKGPASFSVSVGVASFQEPADIGQLMECADKALYEAKRAGRDQVKAWGIQE